MCILELKQNIPYNGAFDYYTCATIRNNVAITYIFFSNLLQYYSTIRNIFSVFLTCICQSDILHYVRFLCI